MVVCYLLYICMFRRRGLEAAIALGLSACGAAPEQLPAEAKKAPIEKPSAVGETFPTFLPGVEMVFHPPKTIKEMLGNTDAKARSQHEKNRDAFEACGLKAPDDLDRDGIKDVKDTHLAKAYCIGGSLKVHGADQEDPVFYAVGADMRAALLENAKTGCGLRELHDVDGDDFPDWTPGYKRLQDPYVPMGLCTRTQQGDRALVLYDVDSAGENTLFDSDDSVLVLEKGAISAKPGNSEENRRRLKACGILPDVVLDLDQDGLDDEREDPCPPSIDCVPAEELPFIRVCRPGEENISGTFCAPEAGTPVVFVEDAYSMGENTCSPKKKLPWQR